MSTVTKPMLLDETGQRIAAALETMAQNGGGSSGGSGSPYVVSYFDILDIVKGKSIDVATLISILEEKISNFATLEVDSQYDFTTTEQVFTSWGVSFIKLVIDSDNKVEIYVNGDYVVTESTTANIKQILTLNASGIENVTFSTFTNLERAYIGSVYFGKYGNETPITVEELKTIFK